MDEGVSEQSLNRAKRSRNQSGAGTERSGAKRAERSRHRCRSGRVGARRVCVCVCRCAWFSYNDRAVRGARRACMCVVWNCRSVQYSERRVCVRANLLQLLHLRDEAQRKPTGEPRFFGKL